MGCGSIAYGFEVCGSVVYGYMVYRYIVYGSISPISIPLDNRVIAIRSYNIL